MARLFWRFYKTPAGKSPVEDFMDTLADDDAVRVLTAMSVVQRDGLRRAVRLTDRVWEVKAAGDKQTFRVLFGRQGRWGQVLLAVEAFSKKTQKAPPRLIRLAEKRLADWETRGRRLRARKTKR